MTQNDDLVITAASADFEIGAEDDDHFDEMFILFNDFVDGELSMDEQREFQARLDSEPDLKNEFEAFQLTLTAVKFSEPVPNLNPEDFVSRLEDTIRTRSRGRFFHDDLFYRMRVPYEVFAIIMLGAISALLISLSPPTPDYDPNTPEKTRNALGGVPERQEAGAPQEPQTRSPDTASPRAQQEVITHKRVEIINYTITIHDPDPESRANTLTSQIKAVSRDFQVSSRPQPDRGQAVTVRMPHGQLKSFLKSFSRLGAVRAKRELIPSNQASPQSTVSLHIIPGDPSDKHKTDPVSP